MTCMILIKSRYKGARASVTTTAGGTVHVFADGSFKYQYFANRLLMMETHMKIVFITQYKLQILIIQEYQI